MKPQVRLHLYPKGIWLLGHTLMGYHQVYTLAWVSLGSVTENNNLAFVCIEGHLPFCGPVMQCIYVYLRADFS